MSIIALAVLFNLIVNFVLVPYSQDMANSHTPSAPLFGAILIGIGVLVLGVEIMRFKRTRDYIELSVILISSLLLSYGVYRLFALSCESCTNGG